MSKTFCSALWYNLFYKESNNKFKPCCVYQPDNNRKYNSAIDFVNSDYMNDVRQKSLNGEWPIGCIRCKTQEEHGLPSDRHSENLRHGVYSPDDVEDLKPEIRVLDYRAGNLCNLKCRICTPEDSTQILKEIIKNPDLKKHYSHPPLSDFKIKEYETFMNRETELNLDLANHEMFLTLNHIKIMGGEPSIDPGVHQYLDWIIDNGYSKNLKLRYTTNATNVNSKWLDYHKHFHRVVINISLDGAGPTFDYIRTPAKWSTIKNNIAKLIEVVNHTNINFVFNLWNCFTINEYYNELLSLTDIGVDKINVFASIRDNQHPRLLPESYKEIIRNTLIQLPKATQAQKQFINDITKYINMPTPPGGNASITRFFEFSKDLDLERDTDLFELSPLYKQLYNDIQNAN